MSKFKPSSIKCSTTDSGSYQYAVMVLVALHQSVDVELIIELTIDRI